jgi:hypothetical protein
MVALKGFDQLPKLYILNVSVGLVICALKLYTYGKIIAVGLTTPVRLARVPGSISTGNKLYNFSQSGD